MAANSGDFYGGAYSGHLYTPTSTLDNVKPSGLGYGPNDQQRLLVGGNILPTLNGRSSQTWETRQSKWLDQPYRPNGTTI